LVKFQLHLKQLILFSYDLPFGCACTEAHLNFSRHRVSHAISLFIGLGHVLITVHLWWTQAVIMHGYARIRLRG